MLSQARWINSKPKKLQISHRAMTCRFRLIEGGGEALLIGLNPSWEVYKPGQGRGGLDKTCEHSFVPFAVVKHLVSFSHASVDWYHHSHCQLRNSMSVLARAVGYVNSLLSSILNINRISAGSCSNNELKLLGGIDVLYLNFSWPDNQNVWLEFG